MSPDSSVRIGNGYGLEDRGSGVQFPTGVGNFSLRHHVKIVSGAHQGSSPMGAGELFPWVGVKLLGREADHSPPSSAEVKECV
jgi:hypothetical protein